MNAQHVGISQRNVILSNVILFMIFAYLGAIVENAAYIFSSEKKEVTNLIATGFPIFSIGAFAILATNRLLRPATKNPFVHFLAYGTVASLIELAGGIAVGAGPNARLPDGTITTWDYSQERFNYKGIISLKHFAIWGALGLVVVQLRNFLLPRLQIGLQCAGQYKG